MKSYKSRLQIEVLFDSRAATLLGEAAYNMRLKNKEASKSGLLKEADIYGNLAIEYIKQSVSLVRDMVQKLEVLAGMDVRLEEPLANAKKLVELAEKAKKKISNKFGSPKKTYAGKDYITAKERLNNFKSKTLLQRFVVYLKTRVL